MACGLVLLLGSVCKIQILLILFRDHFDINGWITMNCTLHDSSDAIVCEKLHCDSSNITLLKIFDFTFKFFFFIVIMVLHFPANWPTGAIVSDAFVTYQHQSCIL